jgi:hypothetical protein
MKFTDNATRAEFIRHVQLFQKSREELNEINQNFTEREKRIFAAGFQDGVGVMLSITDSRELNGAKFRITDLNGGIVPFYDTDRPEYGGTTPEEMEAHPGLVVAIFPH